MLQEQHYQGPLRVIGRRGLFRLVSCVVILGAPLPAWSELSVATTAGSQSCSSHTGGPCDVGDIGVSASATALYGSVTGSTSASNGTATAEALFSDVFSWVNAGDHTLTVGVSTNGSVSGVTQTADYADFQLYMTLQDLQTSSNKATAYYELDIEGSNPLVTTGLPLDVLSIVLPENHQAQLTIQFFLDARGSGETATATDPTGVYIPTTGYTAQSGTTYPTTVPVPAAAFLFGSALAALGWVRRKQASCEN